MSEDLKLRCSSDLAKTLKICTDIKNYLNNM